MRLFISNVKTIRLGTVLVLIFLFSSFFPLKDGGAESRVALVIGNGAYDAGRLSDPPNDAQLMYTTLDGLGFEVTLDTDVNQQKMRSIIRDFGKRLEAQKDAMGLFYYSGHGMQVGGRNYMIPVDMTIENEGDVEIYGVGVDEVLKRMWYAGGSMNIVILDACRNNPFEKSFKSQIKGLGSMDAPKGTLIAFAAQPNKVARQCPGKYSCFTESLAQEIVKPNLTLRDMLLNVRIAVHNRTGGNQVPVVEDQLLTKFYFSIEDDKDLLGSVYKSPWLGFEILQKKERLNMKFLEHADYPKNALVVHLKAQPFVIRFPKLEPTSYGYGAVGLYISEDDLMFKRNIVGETIDTVREKYLGTGMASTTYGDGKLFISHLEAEQGKGFNYLTTGERLSEPNDNFDGIWISKLVKRYDKTEVNLIRPGSILYFSIFHGHALDKKASGATIKLDQVGYLKLIFQ